MTEPLARLLLQLLTLGFALVGISITLAGLVGALLVSPAAPPGLPQPPGPAMPCAAVVLGPALVALAGWVLVRELGLGRPPEE